MGRCIAHPQQEFGNGIASSPRTFITRKIHCEADVGMVGVNIESRRLTPICPSADKGLV
jgi:hypothetical protein